MSQADTIYAYTVFNPADPVVTSKMYNAAGLTAGSVVQAQPAAIAVGNFGFLSAGEISPREVSVEAHATNAAGDLRSVTVDFAAVAGGNTPWNVRIWEDDAATGVPELSNDAINVCVVIHRLPMTPNT